MVRTRRYRVRESPRSAASAALVARPRRWSSLSALSLALSWGVALLRSAQALKAAPKEGGETEEGAPVDHLMMAQCWRCCRRRSL
eukprot:4620498-Alexandrium_andersonii.AAC.1